MLLTVENLTKTYGTKTLFSNISFSISEGEKIGIVGVNGTGKSTLIKAAAGLVNVDAGNFVKMRGLRIGYLPQDQFLEPGNTVLTEVFQGEDPLMQVLREYELVLEESGRSGPTDSIQKRLQQLSQKIDALDGWQVESGAKAVLTQLGIEDYTAKVEELSGGMQKRVALAGSLIRPVELLILDEPTNHLDSDTIAWLESYLAKSKVALLMVTHDRYFLDQVCTKILELDRGQAYVYTGNYTQFLEQQEARLEREEAGERKRQNLLKTELAWMRRGAQARSTKQKARIDRFEELKAVKKPAEIQKVEIAIGASRLGRTVIEFEKVTYTAGSKTILQDFSYVVLRNDRVGILGKNGIGKSTLLNLTAGILKPDSGKITIGQTVKIGYFSQHAAEMDERLRAIEYVQEAARYVTLADGTKLSASQLMERFLFPAELQWTPIANLSGGERRRLFLLRILMEEPNVLLLDEPTNDLDIQTLSILEDFLDQFPGAVLLVSHDRYFIDRLVEKVFVYGENGAIRQYPGGYTDYQNRLKQTMQQEKDQSKQGQEKNVKQEKVREPKKKFSFKEQREYGEIEVVIAAREGELKAVRAQMQTAGADFILLQELTQRETELQAELDHLMERWAYLEEIAQASLIEGNVKDL